MLSEAGTFVAKSAIVGRVQIVQPQLRSASLLRRTPQEPLPNRQQPAEPQEPPVKDPQWRRKLLFLFAFWKHVAEPSPAGLQMPGLSGLDLQDRLIAKGPRIPIVFLTGDPDESLRRAPSRPVRSFS
jgi:hypothetical protein